MKILHYINTLDRSFGGTTTYMQMLALSLRSRAELVFVADASPNPVEISGAKVIFMQSKWYSRSRYKKEWTAILDAEKPDVVHINTIWLPQCAWAQLWAEQKGYKCALTVHGMLEPWIVNRNRWKKKLGMIFFQRRQLQTALWQTVTAIEEKKHVILYYSDCKIADVANLNIDVIPIGIDSESIAKKCASLKSDGEKYILFLSRIHPKKGIEILLDSLCRVREKIAGYKVKIAGDGDSAYVEKLKNFCSENDLNDIVEFVGGVYGDDKWRLISNASVLVLPTYSENFGLVVAEAMSVSIPVITTNTTPWQILADTDSGWCVPVGVEHVADALADFASLSADELQQKGRNAFSVISREYSLGMMGEKLMSFYKKMLS
ncbi:MAG: glycosyltransferase [Bacteroidaceae bacterium]|nr:glycosyltransferase [Bacteroidaceae bacterium]